MKKLFFVFFLLPVVLYAQKTHTVGPKESLFSIGRLYNVHPRELAEFNNISFENGVKIGQVLKIPSVKKMQPLKEQTANTVPVEKDPNANKTTVITTTKTTITQDNTGKPIYHLVQKGETLTMICAKNGNVKKSDVIKWNKLNADGAIQLGAKLIVGYSKNTDTKKEEIKPPVVRKETTPVKSEEKTEKTEAVTKKEEPANPVTNTKTETKVVEPKDFEGGQFKSQFTNQSSNTESGNAAIFKSTSGLDDGKYYCLHNSAPAGTIIKITNTQNQKIIYAKVLDVIPDLKQNKGILIRLSNAAASQLGATDETFNVMLNY
jgi:murein DD-endopeptidase MepM/ murein hydrolase activator NlpD